MLKQDVVNAYAQAHNSGLACAVYIIAALQPLSTMTFTCLQDLPFHIALLTITYMHIMYGGSYVMEDVRITCSRGG